MPRIVDHDARRRLVAEVAAEIVAERGLEAVTFRELADRAGFSTAIVSHYFADKREVLQVTYRHVVRGARQRLLQAVAADPTDVAAGLDALLPLDGIRRRDWKVWFAFWAVAAADADLAAVQRERVLRTREDIAGLLALLPTPPANGDTAARLVMSTVMGVAAQAVFDPDDWPPDRQRDVLRATLAALGAPGRWSPPEAPGETP